MMSIDRTRCAAPLAELADGPVEASFPDGADLPVADEDCSTVDEQLLSLVERDDVAYVEAVRDRDPDAFAAARERARRLKGAVIVGVTDGDSQILLLENDWMDGYGFPGGGVEPGEDWETAAVREVREETGVDVQIVRPLGVHGGVAVSGNQRYRCIYGVHYLAKPVGGTTIDDDPGAEDETILDVGWFGELPDRVYNESAVRAVFEAHA